MVRDDGSGTARLWGGGDMSGDCEMAKCYSRETPKARIIHKCCECGGTIFAGEIYIRHSGVWDAPETFKVCLDCEALRDDIHRSEQRGWDDLVPFRMLGEDVFECRDKVWISRYLDIKRKRGAKIKPWMLEIEREIDPPKLDQG